MRRILKNNKFKETSIKSLFTKRVKNLHEIFVESKDDLKFSVKNSIDITGTVDLTKPPPFIFEMRNKDNILEGFARIKNNSNNLNNIVSIHFGYEKPYIIDKESDSFFLTYVDKASLSWKISNDDNYRTYEFLRQFDLKVYLSIIFLVFELYLQYGKNDKYSIIQRKIISFNKDLNTEGILEKTKPFRPRLINFNSEVIVFPQEDIYQKADEKEYEKILNDYEEKFYKIPELYDSLGIHEGDILFSRDFEFSNITVQIREKYTLYVFIKFIATKENHTFYWEGKTSQSDSYQIGKVDINCTKPNHVETTKDGTSIIHIKYVKYPLEAKSINDYKTLLKYNDSEIIFGPTAHYHSNGPYI